MNLGINISQYEWTKKPIGTKIFELPSEPVYFFQGGVRQSVRINVRTIDVKGEKVLHNVEFITIRTSFECKIDVFSISINEIENIYYDSKHKHYNLIYSWIDDLLYKRSEEEFNNDLKNALRRLSEFLDYNIVTENKKK